MNTKVFNPRIVLAVDEDILEHRASIRCPMRIQADFLKLIAMSSKFNSRSHILNRLSMAQVIVCRLHKE